MAPTDSWSLPPVVHISTLSRELEPSALVVSWYFWWVHSQSLRIVSPVSWMQQSTSPSTAKWNIWAWPLQFHGLTLESSANIVGYSQCTYVPTCSSTDNDQELVWCIFLDVLSYIKLPLNIFGPCWPRYGLRSAWSVPTPIPCTWEKYVLSHDTGKLCFFGGDHLQSMPMGIPWVRLLVSWTWHWTLEMAPCNTPLTPDIWSNEKAHNLRTEQYIP